ncbi:M48 family metallopeptidase, partial [uncultured Anaerovibrio sp.]|uniref:tetratricopeptide repeat protein n=1 Tax=uncultured Anaerovibrio sp. TaxID=361586 RepID=UPI0025F38DDE
YFGEENTTALIKVKSYPWIYKRSMEEIAKLLPYLYVCLLEKYDEDYCQMLPVGLGNILKYFHGIGDETAIKGHYDEYKSFIQNVFDMAQLDTVNRYLDILPVVSSDEGELEKNIMEVAGILLKTDRPEQALALYNLISAESEWVNESFWQNVGICFYKLGQYQESIESLERASKDPKTAAYMAWGQEAMKHGN